MLERKGSIWDVGADAIVIPTNRQVNNKGHAIMGAGVALQAKERYPDLPVLYGMSLKSDLLYNEVNVFVHGEEPSIVCMPSKHNWRDDSDLGLILRATDDLVRQARLFQWTHVALPRIGAGLGNLKWSRVKQVLSVYLDDRFVVYALDTHR